MNSLTHTIRDEHCEWPAPAVTPQPDDFSEGPPDARIVLLHYGDYGAPRCRRLWPELVELRRWLRGEIRYVFRYLSHHPAAPKLLVATALQAATLQDKHWAFHDALFTCKGVLTPRVLQACARSATLDELQFQRDCAALTLPAQTKLASDERYAWLCKATHTPTLFLNGMRYTGALEMEAMTEAIVTRGLALEATTRSHP